MKERIKEKERTARFAIYLTIIVMIASAFIHSLIWEIVPLWGICYVLLDELVFLDTLKGEHEND